MTSSFTYLKLRRGVRSVGKEDASLEIGDFKKEKLPQAPVEAGKAFDFERICGSVHHRAIGRCLWRTCEKIKKIQTFAMYDLLRMMEHSQVES